MFDAWHLVLAFALGVMLGGTINSALVIWALKYSRAQLRMARRRYHEIEHMMAEVKNGHRRARLQINRQRGGVD